MSIVDEKMMIEVAIVVEMNKYEWMIDSMDAHCTTVTLNSGFLVRLYLTLNYIWKV